MEKNVPGTGGQEASWVSEGFWGTVEKRKLLLLKAATELQLLCRSFYGLIIHLTCLRGQ
jgi:hypothetical protein